MPPTAAGAAASRSRSCFTGPAGEKEARNHLKVVQANDALTSQDAPYEERPGKVKPFPSVPLVAVEKPTEKHNLEEYVHLDPVDHQGQPVYGVIGGKVWLGEKGKNDHEAQRLRLVAPVLKKTQEDTLEEAK